MAIHDWYVDSSVESSGDGSQAYPLRSLAETDAAISHAWGDINRLWLKSGTTFYECVPKPMSQSGGLGLYMATYGGTDPATIDATIDCTDRLQYDSARDWYSAMLGTSDWQDQPGKLTIGALLQDGECLPMQEYDEDHPALRAKLAGGGYSCNWDDGHVYMVPFEAVEASTLSKPDKPPGKPGKPPKPPNPPGGSPTEPPPVVQPPAQPTFRVAVSSNVMVCNAPGPYGELDERWNRTFENVVFIGAKRIGVEHNSYRSLFRRCGFYAHGGQQQNTDSYKYLGNGLELFGNSRGVTVEACWFDQIFDSGVTPQGYTAGQVVSGILIQRNDFKRCGLYAIECSVQAGDAATTVRNVDIIGNTIRSNHGCFAPEIYSGRFTGIGILSNAAGSVDHIRVQGNTVEDMRYNGVMVGKSGLDVGIDTNTFRRCDLGIYAYTPVSIGENAFEDCVTNVSGPGI